MQPQWREELWTKLQAAKANIDRATWDAGRAYIDRALELRIAQIALGDTTAVRHRLKDDTQLLRALDLLKSGQTQKDLFTLAQSAARPAR